MKFICKDCNYRFESEFDKTKAPCPYCGKEKIEKQKSADELLKDIE